MLKGLVVFVVLMLVGGFLAGVWFFVKDIEAAKDALIADNATLGEAIKQQQAALLATQEAIQTWKEAAAEQQVVMEAVLDENRNVAQQARKLNDVFKRHDLDRLAGAKPGLIERRVNDGTAAIFGVLESATTLDRDNSNRGRTTGPDKDTKSGTN